MNNTQANTVNTTLSSTTGSGRFGTGMFPLYYIPTPQQRTIPSHLGEPVLHGSQYQGILLNI